MLNDNMTRSRIVKAALRLIEEKGWRGLALGDVAAAADVSLADLHREFRGKLAILVAFVDEVDKEVLKRSKQADTATPARDRIFEVIMTRLDVLKPHKAALNRLHDHCRCALPGPGAARLLCASANSHKWMLTAAGIPVRGPMGCARVSGMMCAYARVMPVWLRDDDPDQAKTMAALDRVLSEGERWLHRLDGLCCDIGRLACCFAPRRRGRDGDWRDRDRTRAEPPPPPPAAGPAEQPSAG